MPTPNTLTIFEHLNSDNSSWNYLSIDANGLFLNTLNVISQLIVGNVVINTTSVSVGGIVLGGSGGSSDPNPTYNSITIQGDARISGNLYLENNTTIFNSTSIISNDKQVILSANATSTLLANASGLIIANVGSLLYDDNTISFQSNLSITPSINNSSLGGPNNLWNLYANQITGILVTPNQYNITSNNSLYLGGIAAANYFITSGLSSNVLTLTANSANFIGTLSSSNVVSNAQLQANLSNYELKSNLINDIANSTANNTNFFGGNPVGFYANVTAPYFSVSVNVGSNISINTSVINIVGGIQANGSLGTNNAVIMSDGANIYWSAISLTPNVRNISTSNSLSITDDVIIVNAASNITFNLIPASSVNNRIIRIKNKTKNTINVIANTDTIDGNTSITIGFQYTNMEILSTGNNWSIM